MLGDTACSSTALSCTINLSFTNDQIQQLITGQPVIIPNGLTCFGKMTSSMTAKLINFNIQTNTWGDMQLVGQNTYFSFLLSQFFGGGGYPFQLNFESKKIQVTNTQSLTSVCWNGYTISLVNVSFTQFMSQINNFVLNISPITIDLSTVTQQNIFSLLYTNSFSTQTSNNLTITIPSGTAIGSQSNANYSYTTSNVTVNSIPLNVFFSNLQLIVTTNNSTSIAGISGTKIISNTISFGQQTNPFYQGNYYVIMGTLQMENVFRSFIGCNKQSCYSCAGLVSPLPEDCREMYNACDSYYCGVMSVEECQIAKTTCRSTQIAECSNLYNCTV
jgi:hypothetical protein